jgi:hypothetical protein
MGGSFQPAGSRSPARAAGETVAVNVPNTAGTSNEQCHGRYEVVAAAAGAAVAATRTTAVSAASRTSRMMRRFLFLPFDPET